ncbi:MAG TPA: hypothetical protein VHN80_32240 [Kineosporiaceae bacterium]|nr:hypothetical protein [Kineosporiaceae bacterium]
MWLLLCGYVLGLVWRGDGFSLVVDGWLGTLVEWVPAACCWVAFWQTGRRRAEVALAAVAVSAFAAGNTYFNVVTWWDGASPFPSPADAGYLMFYPAMLAALALEVRRRLRGVAGSVWLDSAVGSLGAAAVLAVLLGPVLASALSGGSLSLATVISVVYPMGDLLLVAAV